MKIFVIKNCKNISFYRQNRHIITAGAHTGGESIALVVDGNTVMIERVYDGSHTVVDQVSTDISPPLIMTIFIIIMQLVNDVSVDDISVMVVDMSPLLHIFPLVISIIIIVSILLHLIIRYLMNLINSATACFTAKPLSTANLGEVVDPGKL